MRVAFVGKAGSGKTTHADLLVAEYGFVRLSFATKIKEFGAQILQRPINKLDPKDRRFLQRFGGLARDVDPNVWINWLRIEIERLDGEGKSIVVDDCRRHAEADFLREQGFVIVKIRGRAYVLEKALAEDTTEVESETIVADYEVDANKPLEAVTADVRALVAKIASENVKSA